MRFRLATPVVTLAILAVPGFGAVITETIGTPNYTNGQVVGSATFALNPSGDPVPFDRVIGADVAGPNFSASWTFNTYGPVVGTISSATLLIASWDFDTNNTSGSQVASFDMNGTNLATILNTAFTSNRNLANNEIRWYTISLPGSAFAQLATGSATFNLALQNGRGLFGGTQFNGGGMDFSTLTVNAAAPTPEPSAAFAAIGGLAAFALARRKRSA